MPEGRAPLASNHLRDVGAELHEDGTIETYPVTTTSITVHHYQKAEDLSDTDVPDIPAEYHYTIVLEAARRGKLENGELEASGAYKSDYDAEVAQMKRDVFNVQTNPVRSGGAVIEGYN